MILRVRVFESMFPLVRACARRAPLTAAVVPEGATVSTYGTNMWPRLWVHGSPVRLRGRQRLGLVEASTRDAGSAELGFPWWWCLSALIACQEAGGPLLPGLVSLRTMGSSGVWPHLKRSSHGDTSSFDHWR